MQATDPSPAIADAGAVKDELLAAIVTTPQPGQVLAAVSIRLPYAKAASVELVDLAAVSASTAAALTSRLSSASTAKTSATNWLLAALLALALATAHNLDGPADHSAEWASSSELQTLQATERGTQRREAAAQALCTAERGPQSEARWTPEGDLVCTSRRNAHPVQLASKVQP